MPRKNTAPLGRKKGLYLKDAGHKGRGVFCDTDIRAGEVLEVTPGIILNEKDTGHADKTLLKDYTFVVGKLPKRLHARLGIRETGECSAVVMGLAAFCNHDEHPNAGIEWEEKGGTVYYSLRATRRIPKGTEICTSYGDGWFDDRD